MGSSSQPNKNRSLKAGQGFTRKEHREMGKKLAQINADLEELVGQVRISYGRSGRSSLLGRAASEALDKFRAALYCELANETGSNDWREEKLVQIYIGTSVEEGLT